ncbi:hypothetical protein CRUP_002098 [Coryphaenoides rupestris]|nr:hypothetical protein CRUP_002098 [Coryphaenoides rupestris]
MAYLYLELLKDSLNEYAYAAELAGLNYDLQNTIYGMFLPSSPALLISSHYLYTAPQYCNMTWLRDDFKSNTPAASLASPKPPV